MPLPPTPPPTSLSCRPGLVSRLCWAVEGSEDRDGEEDDTTVVDAVVGDVAAVEGDMSSSTAEVVVFTNVIQQKT